MKALPLLSMAAALSHTLLGCGSLFSQDIERRKSKAQDSSLSFHTHTHVDKHAIGCHKCFLLLSMQGTQYNYICESIRFNPENYETCAKVMSPDQISQFFWLSKTLFRLKTRIDQELDFYFFFLIIIELYDFRFRPHNFPSSGKLLAHTPKTLNYIAFVENTFPAPLEKNRSTLYSFFTFSNED